MATNARDGRRRIHRTCVLAASLTLLAALAGGLAWASDELGPTPQHPRSASFAAKLALLRKVASPGGGWAPLRAGIPDPVQAKAAVRVWTDATGARVPEDFLGLSFEATALTSFSSLSQGGTLTRLLRSLGRGTLHFGGGTANRYVGWKQPGTPAPGWASHVLSPQNFRALASLVDQVGWKVLLTVNFAHYDPLAAAQETASAHEELGSALYAMAIGNEPDRFSRFGLRGPKWGFPGYAHQLAAYRAAIAASAPSARIAAPEASTGEPPLPWVWESIGLHPAILTDHYYPLTRCGHKPTVTQLLSPAVRLKESVMLKALEDIQSTARRPLLLDEANNVSCKGQPGVSNTFASALWAADFIARAMKTGLRGVELHNLLNRPRSYSPLVGEGRSLHPNPEWYALLLTRSLQGARVLPTAVHSRSEITAQAFRRPNGTVKLLLVNFDRAGRAPARVTVKTPGRATEGTVMRLTAPSVSARSHVKLGGKQVAASGAWHPKLPLLTAHASGDSLAVSMPPSSAALVTIPPLGAERA